MGDYDYANSWWVEGSLIFAFVLVLGCKLVRKYDYFKLRGFPSLSAARGLWLTFKIFTFRINLSQFLDEIYKEFDGHKIFGYYQVGRKVLVMRDPELVNRVLVKDFSYFHDHGFDVDTDVSPLEGHLFNMKGHKWRALRNKLAPTFTTGKLKLMLPQIEHCTDTLISIIRQHKSDQDILIRDLLSRFSIDVIGSCAFGLEAGALKDPDCEFRRMARKIFTASRLNILKSLIRSLSPRLAARLRLRIMDADVDEFFLGITRQAFEHRLKTGLRRNDFVDLLLQLKLKGTVDCDPKELTEEEEEEEEENTVDGTHDRESSAEKLVFTDGLLAAQAFIFLVGGWENTAHTASFLLYSLAKHPDVQTKARQEVRRLKQKYGGRHLTYEALKQMVYLESCISETLRLHSPIDALFHECTKTYTMDDGRVIDKGTTIIVPTSSMQRDPAHFQDPEQFRPERFMPDSQIRSSVYMPFGDGPRICIARKFVLLEIKLLVSKLLDEFRFTNSPNLKEPIRHDRRNY